MVPYWCLSTLFFVLTQISPHILFDMSRCKSIMKTLALLSALMISCVLNTVNGGSIHCHVNFLFFDGHNQIFCFVFKFSRPALVQGDYVSTFVYPYTNDFHAAIRTNLNNIANAAFISEKRIRNWFRKRKRSEFLPVRGNVPPFHRNEPSWMISSVSG